MSEEQQANPRELTDKETRQLVELNVNKYGVNFCGTIKVNCYHKYTIVEIISHGKCYHGLSSKTLSDKYNWYTGVATAFNRAFEYLAVDIKKANKKKMKKLLSRTIVELFESTKIPVCHMGVDVAGPRSMDASMACIMSHGKDNTLVVEDLFKIPEWITTAPEIKTEKDVIDAILNTGLGRPYYNSKIVPQLEQPHVVKQHRGVRAIGTLKQ